MKPTDVGYAYRIQSVISSYREESYRNWNAIGDRYISWRLKSIVHRTYIAYTVEQCWPGGLAVLLQLVRSARLACLPACISSDAILMFLLGGSE